MRKRNLVILVSALMLVSASSLFFINIFINQHRLKDISIGSEIKTGYFSFKVFGRNIFGSSPQGNIFKTRILEVGGKLLYPPQIIYSSGDQRILFFYRDRVSLYSKAKNKVFRYSFPNETIISGCVSSLYKNDQNLLLLVSKNRGLYADSLVIYRISGMHKDLVLISRLEKSLNGLNPMKLQTCDVDGDGKCEISVCMYKTTPFNPIMAKRPFLYKWTGTDIAPKWLGSRLSRPFKDYIFADVNHDGRDELVSIEVLKNNKQVVNAYAWKGFGFESIGESSEYRDISAIKRGNNIWKAKDYVLIYARDNGKASSFTLKYRNGRLITESVSTNSK